MREALIGSGRRWVFQRLPILLIMFMWTLIKTAVFSLAFPRFFFHFCSWAEMGTPVAVQHHHKRRNAKRSTSCFGRLGILL
jgi:hypothetical protein